MADTQLTDDNLTVAQLRQLFLSFKTDMLFRLSSPSFSSVLRKIMGRLEAKLFECQLKLFSSLRTCTTQTRENKLLSSGNA